MSENILSILPALLLLAVFVFAIYMQRGRGGPLDYQRRQAEALERIATALEKRQ